MQDMNHAGRFLAKLVVFTALLWGLLVNFAFSDTLKAIKQIEEEEKKADDNFNIAINTNYDASMLRDPFQSYIITEKNEKPVQEGSTGSFQMPPLSVQGIIWGGSLSQAIINGKVLIVGDTIEDAKILEINDKGVKMIYKNHEFSISSPAVISINNINSKFKGGQNDKQ